MHLEDNDNYNISDDDCGYEIVTSSNDDCGYEIVADIEISGDSLNPLEFEGGFNIRELLRLLNNKVDKVRNKGLSTNDFTDAFKNILSGLNQTLSAYVLKTTTINGKPLTGDIVLTPSDINVESPVTYREIIITLINQTEITLLYTPQLNKEVVCINGLVAYPGTDNDYILQNNIISFNYPLLAGERVMVTYLA